MRRVARPMVWAGNTIAELASAARFTIDYLESPRTERDREQRNIDVAPASGII